MYLAPHFLLAGLAAASPHIPVLKRGIYDGMATFNNFGAQGSTVCGKRAGSSGTYGAAAGTLSPDISGGACTGSIDLSQCSGQSPVPGYSPPNCPTSNCGKCYKVTNDGGMDGSSSSGGGKSIIVQIIDSCPAESAENFCKTDVPANQRCGDSSTNQLDIDQSAYMPLTGQAFGGGANLRVSIEDICCPGVPGCVQNSPSVSPSSSLTALGSPSPSQSSHPAQPPVPGTGVSGDLMKGSTQQENGTQQAGGVQQVGGTNKVSVSSGGVKNALQGSGLLQLSSGSGNVSAAACRRKPKPRY